MRDIRLRQLHPEQARVEPCAICGHLPDFLSREQSGEMAYALRCARHPKIIGTEFIIKHQSVAIARWNISQNKLKHLIRGQFQSTALGVKLRDRLSKKRKPSP